MKKLKKKKKKRVEKIKEEKIEEKRGRKNWLHERESLHFTDDLSEKFV